ncbi:hypothetical protein EVAR_23474_1 [Eumeta japonica]|uniref:Uncharacterized protein n=1 Tax=Eumeta variegata TaxID=151549 RepID=A0A4C1UJS3_EUMVA|nr:hypothetical protein EVAR_23474_1 [Eumeta japonica]
MLSEISKKYLTRRGAGWGEPLYWRRRCDRDTNTDWCGPGGGGRPRGADGKWVPHADVVRRGRSWSPPIWVSDGTSLLAKNLHIFDRSKWCEASAHARADLVESRCY